MLKMTIDNEEVLSNNDISIKEEILSPSSTILNNVYPKSWEQDKDYVSRFYYPKDYSKLNIQNFSVEPEEAGTTIQVNGNATLTDVDTTKESRVLRLLGQTSQNGTPTPSSPIPVNVVSGDNTIDICGKNLLGLQENTYSSNGITANVSNGEITLNGTATANTFISLYTNNTINWVDSQTYTMNAFNPILNSNVRIRLETSGSKDIILNPANKTAQIEYSEDLGLYTDRIQIRVQNGTTLTNFKLQPMLVKGTTAPTTYEPYQGNTYNIDLPVENLLNLPNGSKTTNGITATITNGKLKIVGTTTTNWFSICNLNIPLESGTYTFSYTNKKVNRYNLNIKYADNTTQVIYGNAYSNTPITLNQKATITAMFSDNNTTGATFDYEDYLMIEKGSKANSYTPYGTTPIELCKIGNYQDYFGKSDGRNLFDKSTITTSAYLKEDGTLQTGTGAEYITSDFIPVKPNTTYYKTQTLSPRTKFYDKNKQVLDSSTYQDISIGGNAGSFTTPNNAYYFRFTGNVNTSTGININTTMVNEGSSALPYEPYGVGWYLHKEIGKVVLDGTQNITQATSGIRRFNATYTTLGLTNIKDGTGSYNSANYRMCDHFIHMDANHTSQLWGIYYLYNNWLVMFDTESVMADANALKTWLLSNPTTIYYVLATPTNTPIEDTTLIEQLEALSS